ncbi:MAG: hypothetical protein IPG09_18445 [Ignavibacteria bacterium]|nr:hypothetical protein [Ignavibacteria bacterium]
MSSNHRIRCPLSTVTIAPEFPSADILQPITQILRVLAVKRNRRSASEFVSDVFVYYSYIDSSFVESSSTSILCDPADINFR